MRAEELLEETLRLAPRYAQALHLLGAVLVSRGSSQRALEVLQEAQAANPLNAETYFQMGSAYYQSGRLTEALEMNQRALVLDEEDAQSGCDRIAYCRRHAGFGPHAGHYQPLC